MPIYEYQCKQNGHKFEVIQKFSDAPLKKCRQCNSPVVKLISASSFVLKGSGFYVNDYAKKNGGGDKKKSKETSHSASESASETKSESKSESSSESKSESKPDSKSDAGPATSTPSSDKKSGKTTAAA